MVVIRSSLTIPGMILQAGRMDVGHSFPTPPTHNDGDGSSFFVFPGVRAHQARLLEADLSFSTGLGVWMGLEASRVTQLHPP